MRIPKDSAEARNIQLSLRQKVIISPLTEKPEFIAGLDAAFKNNKIIAAACLYEYPALKLLEDSVVTGKIAFPYIPGFLSFREGPALIRAIHKLHTRPDVLLFDGQGIAHPLGLGIASHVGVICNIPSIGCAKSRLTGQYSEPGQKKGSHTDLCHGDRSIGAVLRTRDHVRPLFVSPGHLIDTKTCIEIVLHCTRIYRLPEPIRRADRLSKELKDRK